MLVLTFRIFFCLSILGASINSFEALKISGKAWLANSLISYAWAQSKLDSVSQKPWPWADFSPLGELLVPRIDERHIFLSGDNGNVLAFGPGINLNGAMPGKIGTALISGHRDTHFSFLKDLVVGDEIFIELRNQQVSYTVSAIEVLNGDELVTTKDTQGSWLVLVTCFPFDALGSSPEQRYLVIAENTEVGV